MVTRAKRLELSAWALAVAFGAWLIWAVEPQGLEHFILALYCAIALSAAAGALFCWFVAAVDDVEAAPRPQLVGGRPQPRLRATGDYLLSEGPDPHWYQRPTVLIVHRDARAR